MDISRIPRAELLRQLWGNQIIAGFYANMPALAPKWVEPVDARQDFDYYCGRAIKTDLRKDLVHTGMYNRDAGAGVFERIVEDLRSKYP